MQQVEHYAFEDHSLLHVILTKEGSKQASHSAPHHPAIILIWIYKTLFRCYSYSMELPTTRIGRSMLQVSVLLLLPTAELCHHLAVHQRYY